MRGAWLDKRSSSDMALSGCNACLKYIVLVFNLLFWLAGVGILSIAIWLRIDFANYLRVHDDVQTYYTGTYILMASGTIMTLVGFFGCCGAYRESQCMLGTFFALLLIIFAVEVAAGIWAYVHKDELYKMVESNLLYTIQKEYYPNPAKKEALDLIQKELGCCGSRGYKDWIIATDDGAPPKTGPDALPSYGPTNPSDKSNKFTVPLSCCKPYTNEKLCNRDYKLEAQHVDTIYTEGCAQKLEEHLSERLGVVAGIGIGIAIIEVLGMIFSLILCCALRRERFKI